MIPDEDRKRFGEWLKTNRQAAQQTQTHTARKVRKIGSGSKLDHPHYSQTWVSKVEHGEILNLTTSQILVLAEAVVGNSLLALIAAGCVQPRPAQWLQLKGLQ